MVISPMQPVRGNRMTSPDELSFTPQQQAREAMTDAAGQFLTEPIPMLLWCPECGDRHVDVGTFASKPHHTHACQRCGHCWRPAIVPTVGVQFLPGFKTAEPVTVWPRGMSAEQRNSKASELETLIGSASGGKVTLTVGFLKEVIETLKR